jgi:hypothetical protein
MRQREEHHIMISKHLAGRLLHDPIEERNQVWMVLAEECSGIRASGYRPELHIGMGKQQPK